jgi:hypothetical protein
VAEAAHRAEEIPIRRVGVRGVVQHPGAAVVVISGALEQEPGDIVRDGLVRVLIVATHPREELPGEIGFGAPYIPDIRIALV